MSWAHITHACSHLIQPRPTTQAKRHEVQLSALGDAHEASRSELRALIRQLAEQLVPIQEETASHAEMIEHCCAAINLFAETVRPSTGRAGGGGDGAADLDGAAAFAFSGSAFGGFGEAAGVRRSGVGSNRGAATPGRDDRRRDGSGIGMGGGGSLRISPSRAYADALRAFRADGAAARRGGAARGSPGRRRD